MINPETQDQQRVHHKLRHRHIGDRSYMLGGKSSVAGDTSEGSTTGPMLRSIDEISQLDEDSLRESE